MRSEGRAFSSDLSVNVFVMVVYEKCFQACFEKKFWLNLIKTISHRQPLWNYLQISQKWVLFLQGTVPYLSVQKDFLAVAK